MKDKITSEDYEFEFNTGPDLADQVRQSLLIKAMERAKEIIPDHLHDDAEAFKDSDYDFRHVIPTEPIPVEDEQPHVIEKYEFETPDDVVVLGVLTTGGV